MNFGAKDESMEKRRIIIHLLTSSSPLQPSRQKFKSNKEKRLWILRITIQNGMTDATNVDEIIRSIIITVTSVETDCFMKSLGRAVPNADNITFQAKISTVHTVEYAL